LSKRRIGILSTLLVWLYPHPALASENFVIETRWQLAKEHVEHLFEMQAEDISKLFSCDSKSTQGTSNITLDNYVNLQVPRIGRAT